VFSSEPKIGNGNNYNTLWTETLLLWGRSLFNGELGVPVVEHGQEW
jgi:hypothetical protein